MLVVHTPEKHIMSKCAYCRRPGIPVHVPAEDFLSTNKPTHLCHDHRTILYGINPHTQLELLPPIALGEDGYGMWLVVSTDQDAPPRSMVVLADCGRRACEVMVAQYHTPCSAAPLGDAATEYDLRVVSSWLRSGAHKSDTWSLAPDYGDE